MFLVQNEQAKLTATWLNTLGAAVVTAGVFAPAAALIYQLAPAAIDLRTMVAVAFGCLVLGGALHMAGRVLLWRLRE